MDMQKRLPRIVVLGGGLGGTLAAYEIADLVSGRPVVTYVCDDGQRWFTQVYGTDGQPSLQIPNASVLATDESHVLLAAADEEAAGEEHGEGGITYLLDVDTLTITRIARGLHESHVALEAGLVLWNNPGPIDDNDVYDVVWKVARLP